MLDYILTYPKSHVWLAGLKYIQIQIQTKNGEERVLLQIETPKKATIINIAEYLNTKHKEDQFVNITLLKATNTIM
jgi:hypothetical protein